MEKAQAAALRALELDESQANAHSALAQFRMFLDWDWEGAEQSALRAMEFSPGGATGRLWYGYLLTTLGRHEEAIPYLRLFRERDPLLALGASSLGGALLRNGQVDEAMVEFERAIELVPSTAFAHRGIGFGYCLRGMYEEGIAALERGRSVAGDDPGIVSTLARCHAMSGDRDEAIRLLAELEARAAQSPVDPTLFAEIHLQLGDVDEAFEWLERAYTEHIPTLPLLLQAWFWEPLYTDPRFDDLLARIGVPMGPHPALQLPGS